MPEFIPEHLQPIYDMPLDELVEKAKMLVCDLANGKQKWRMCIPPQWDDTDTFLFEVIERLYNQVKALEASE